MDSPLRQPAQPCARMGDGGGRPRGGIL